MICINSLNDINLFIKDFRPVLRTLLTSNKKLTTIILSNDFRQMILQEQ